VFGGRRGEEVKSEGQWKKGRVFFFQKKKQKTFVT
jgi:hypothetical protein